MYENKGKLLFENLKKNKLAKFYAVHFCVYM